MSVRVMAWVWDNGPDSPTEKLVLLAIADFCDDAGNCWPSMARIAAKACIEERSARRIVRRLEVAGYLETVPGGGRHGCNQYRIRMADQEPELPLAKPGQKVPPDRRSPRTLSAQNPDPECTKPGPTGPPNHQEPSLTVSNRDAREARAILCKVASPDAVDDYLDHRKAKRAKVTPRAAELIAKKLADCSDPDAVLRLSVANGWTGVFPERNERSHHHDRPSATDIARRAGERWAARGMDSGPGADPSEPLFQPRVIPGGSGGSD